MGYERYDTFPEVLYLLQVVYMSEQAGSDDMISIFQYDFGFFDILTSSLGNIILLLFQNLELILIQIRLLYF